METFKIENLSFTYPDTKKPALSHINLRVDYGEFLVLCGQTGCGKTTLLRHLKNALMPHGQKQGEILFYGRPLDSIDHREQAKRIGYVFQNPDNQIVTDKVWHELAFGLESLGYDSKTIRLRVAEMANFFGIQSWFHEDVSKLSGGQKQILNLASIMAMQPDVLILDEPTAQLDPIAATEFIETVKKINQDVGTTIIIIEHRLEDLFPMADRVIVMDKGRILVDDIPGKVGRTLRELDHPMLYSMPAPMQIYEGLNHGSNMERQWNGGKVSNESPITIRRGRGWLTDLFEERHIKQDSIEEDSFINSGRAEIKEELTVVESGQNRTHPTIDLKNVWFRYAKEDRDIVKGLSMSVNKGQLYCIIGGNGTGKTTALSLISGINKPYRGSITVFGEEISKKPYSKIKERPIILPQNPQTLFVEKTVALDLMEVLDSTNLIPAERENKIEEISQLTEIHSLMKSHPYDLSGGEQQRVALAKVLLKEPKILLLDEPTKGLDNHFKQKLATILKSYTEKGMTVIMVSHDIEFCARYGDYCGMVFDGDLITSNTPRRFFPGNSFYTTAANRMSRHIFKNAITAEDVVELCRINL